MITSDIIVKGDKEFLEACKQALEPEEDFKTDRAKYKTKLGKNNLTIKVRA